MITLSTLHDATLQQIFEQCVNHLLTQKQICRTTGLHQEDVCLYRNGDLRCAAGCFISDDEYDEKFENKNISSVCEIFFKQGLSIFSNEDFNRKVTFMKKMQKIHDNEKIKHWKQELQDLGRDYKLNIDFVSQYEN